MSLSNQKPVILQEDISLIECLFWQRGTYRHLEKHVRRLQCSAHYFGYRFDVYEMCQLLEEQSETLKSSQAYKVRLLLTAQGRLTMEVGGAITIQSDAEQEFAEILLKGQALMETIASLATGGGEASEALSGAFRLNESLAFEGLH